MRVVLTAALLMSCVWNISLADPAQRRLIASEYDQLKSISRDRGEVRVIARVSETGSATGRRARTVAALDQLRNRMSQAGVAPLRGFRNLPLAVYSLTESQLDFMLDSGLVESVSEDRLNAPSLFDSVPWIGGDVAHNLGLTGNGAAVAIIDTGVDATHSDFGGRVVEEACFSTAYAPYGATSLCPGGATDGAYGPGAAAPCDICWHGTHVASTAAGNGGQWIGVAPAADIIAVQVFSRFSSPSVCGAGITDCIRAFDSDVIDGLEYVETLTGSRNVASVNMSLGGSQYAGTCDGLAHKPAIDALRAAEVVVVAASGNQYWSSAINAPACISTAVAVGSVFDADGSVSAFSNASAEVDILAPGQGISAAVPGPSNGHGGASGTSMATPHIAGSLALLKGSNSSMTADEMMSVLIANSVPVLDGRNGLTFPRVDLAQVAAAVVNVDADGDGMLDSWEALYGVDDPSGDPDGDSLTNLQEHDLGTNPVDAAPQVAITSPASGSVVAAGANLTLVASATDVEDGGLSGAIEWSSQSSGPLGSGGSIVVSFGSGTQVITATVLDSQGAGPVTVPTLSLSVVEAGTGDFNGDALVDAADLLLLQRALLGVVTPDAQELLRADLHPDGGDGVLSVADLLRLTNLLLAP